MIENNIIKVLEIYLSCSGKRYFIEGVEVPFSWIEGKSPLFTKIYFSLDFLK